MGGLGSGRFGRRSWRPRVEECYWIDAGALDRQGVLVAGERVSATLEFAPRREWPRRWTAAVHVAPVDDALRVSLTYEARSHMLVDVLTATATPQPFGGVRWWWSCPACGRRCAKLYRPLRGEAQRFRCRGCHRLTYTSQALAMPERWRWRAQALYARVGTHAHADFHYKPKRMRWTTFNRILDKAEEFDEAHVGWGLRQFARSFSAAMR